MAHLSEHSLVELVLLNLISWPEGTSFIWGEQRNKSNAIFEYFNPKLKIAQNYCDNFVRILDTTLAKPKALIFFLWLLHTLQPLSYHLSSRTKISNHGITSEPIKIQWVLFRNNSYDQHLTNFLLFFLNYLKHIRLPAPYKTKCRQDRLPGLGSYTKDGCIFQCLANYTLAQCGCRRLGLIG